MRLSTALCRVLEACVADQNPRLGALLASGVLSGFERSVVRHMMRCNESELLDPVMGPYHRGDAPAALGELARCGDPRKGYRLAVAASVRGDVSTLRAMRSSGIRIASLTGGHGPAVCHAVASAVCLAEFLDDGADPNASWTSLGNRPYDLMTRAAEIVGGAEVVRTLVERGARCTDKALTRALEKDNDDAAVIMLCRDPSLSVPAERRTARVLASMCRVHRRIIADASREAEELRRELNTARAEHERFVAVELPSLLACAVGSYSSRINELLRPV
jgi:hypothetical protein